jgi:hypothetical protein
MQHRPRADRRQYLHLAHDFPDITLQRRMMIWQLIAFAVLAQPDLGQHAEGMRPY